jgi:hypothetical protein
LSRIAKNIERYNLAYRLAWKHISERQKHEHPNVATLLHDAIRRQLTEGAVDPVLIAAEALGDIEKLTGQSVSDEEQLVPTDDRNNRLRRALRFVTGPMRGSQNDHDHAAKLMPVFNPADGPVDPSTENENNGR